jgi:hypothetical protein
MPTVVSPSPAIAASAGVPSAVLSFFTTIAFVYEPPRGSRPLVFVSKIKLEDLWSMRLNKLPQRHAARASRSGAERAGAGGGGERRGVASPVPRAHFLLAFFPPRGARGERERKPRRF